MSRPVSRFAFSLLFSGSAKSRGKSPFLSPFSLSFSLAFKGSDISINFIIVIKSPLGKAMSINDDMTRDNSSIMDGRKARFFLQFSMLSRLFFYYGSILTMRGGSQNVKNGFPFVSLGIKGLIGVDGWLERRKIGTMIPRARSISPCC